MAKKTLENFVDNQNDRTKQLREKHPNYDIQIGSTEIHQQLTQILSDNEDESKVLFYKSQVSIMIFLPATEAGKAALIDKKVMATGTSLSSMQEAEDNAIDRALTILGL